MLKSLFRQPWTCAKCIRQQRNFSKNFHRALSTSSPITETYKKPDNLNTSWADHNPPGARHDDATLRQIFDSQPFWQEFSQSSKYGKSVGLLRIRYLTTPQGFEQFAKSALAKARQVVTNVLSASSIDEYKNIVHDLDRLSDLLCSVIDVADFIRGTHPDKAVQDAAAGAYALMFEYMNVLNTTTGLNSQLITAKSIPEVWNSWTEEEKAVAEILLRDFSKSAIDLPSDMRRKFVELSNDISEIGAAFESGKTPKTDHITLKSHQLNGLDPRIVRAYSRLGGRVTLPTTGSIPYIALQSVHDESTRKEIYTAWKTSSRKQVHRLESLLRKRAEVARLCGYESFAHQALDGKMAGSPDSVSRFLEALSLANAPFARSDLNQLSELKKQRFRDPSANMHPWDIDYYSDDLLYNHPSSSLARSTRHPDNLSAYLSVGTLVQGVSRLFTRLYGIRFVPCETLPGETWHPDVRRLNVVSDTGGHIGVLYCDLFSRPGKMKANVHFTLRCSREISAAEIMESYPTDLFSSAIEAATDGMAVSSQPQSQAVGADLQVSNEGKQPTYKQLPTIALVCDFKGPSDRKPSCLSFDEAKYTFFHEFGHAVHSLLGRTSLQNVAGTRCTTDFSEFPSILTEFFFSDPSVLSLFARHWQTDAPIPLSLINQHVRANQLFSANKTERQILLSLLDQALYTRTPTDLADPSFSSVNVYHDLQDRYTAVGRDPPSTSWLGFMSHLFGYGATYYSYLFDRAIAMRVWKKVFAGGDAGGAVDRENGERLAREVLRFGGGRDPWKCVANVLGGEDVEVEEGGEKAMERVGGWGTAVEDR